MFNFEEDLPIGINDKQNISLIFQRQRMFLCKLSLAKNQITRQIFIPSLHETMGITVSDSPSFGNSAALFQAATALSTSFPLSSFSLNPDSPGHHFPGNQLRSIS